MISSPTDYLTSGHSLLRSIQLYLFHRGNQCSHKWSHIFKFFNLHQQKICILFCFSQISYLIQQQFYYKTNMNTSNPTYSANHLGTAAGIFSDTYVFHGNFSSLQGRMNTISDTNTNSIKQASVSVVGKHIKQTDNCCICLTIGFGAIFIFPLFFMCCDWWRKKVHPAFDVPESSYESLQSLLSCPNLTSLTLTVTDSLFNQSKSQILYKILSKSHLKYFGFFNNAQNYDYYDHEFSHFDRYMAKFNELPMKTECRWSKYMN